jgi:4-amino-4-deoxy-L-arabinose transferase-like glycosyltransferase
VIAWPALAEGLALLVSPVVAFFVLRMRSMAPAQTPDPGLHTVFIVDPRDVFLRYSQAYAATTRMREGARVGFLIPARISYLLFGGAGGFFALRFVLALVAVVPLYLLLRRIYGRLAGVAGAIVVLSSPVVINAWGTDYPDSAVISYLIGALACLAMPSSPRRRRGWLTLGGGLLVMATWAHGIGALLTIVTLACYLAVRLCKDRPQLLGDMVLLACVGALGTLALMVLSKLLLGQFDFIVPTIDSLRYLSQPAEEVTWHSTNWRWAPYVAYILVPPAVVAGFLAAFAGRLRSLETPQLLVGLACSAQLVVCVYLQFFGKLQTLEYYFFSSMLWASVLVAFSVIVAEIARRSLDNRLARLIPPVLLLAVPIGYAADGSSVPTFGWAPWGFLLAGLAVVAIGVARLTSGLRRRSAAWAAAGAGILGSTVCLLLLTVAQIPVHAQLKGEATDVPPFYSTALGGSGTAYVDEYRVSVELPAWVGNATYPGEQLLLWTPREIPVPLVEPLSIYHAAFNTLPGSPPVLGVAGRQMLDQRRPAELLLIGASGASFGAAVSSLAPYGAQVMRSTVLTSGSYSLHVGLLSLDRYPPA